MATPLSIDLRVRVLASVEAGLSHREAAERFGVSAASVSRWRTLDRAHGDPSPKAMGGDHHVGSAGDHPSAVHIEDRRKRGATSGRTMHE